MTEEPFARRPSDAILIVLAGLVLMATSTSRQQATYHSPSWEIAAVRRMGQGHRSHGDRRSPWNPRGLCRLALGDPEAAAPGNEAYAVRRRLAEVRVKAAG